MSAPPRGVLAVDKYFVLKSTCVTKKRLIRDKLYIGEGFDDARLDTLFLAMPISWKGTLQQYVGRLHRLHDNKRFVQVYDYVDHYVPMLARMYERRLKSYSTIGYVIEAETLLPDSPTPLSGRVGSA